MGRFHLASSSSVRAIMIPESLEIGDPDSAQCLDPYWPQKLPGDHGLR